MRLEFFASEVDTDVRSYWSDERWQDVHELCVMFAADAEEPGIGFSVWREYNTAGDPDRFATAPLIAHTDREPTDDIVQVELTRQQIRITLPRDEDVIAHFDLEQEEFERIRSSLQELFTDCDKYSERIAEPGAAADRRGE
jgi:hypothetical protein